MRAFGSPRRSGRPAPAVFLDRDGTLIHDREGHYLTDPRRLKLYKDAPRALRALAALGFRLIVLTNQSGVGRGYMTLARSVEINRALAAALKSRGVRLEGIYFCPHRPDEGCRCRKPAPGLLREAARAHRADLSRSFVVGDKKGDMELARACGLRAVFVETGHGRPQLAKHGPYLKAFPRAAGIAGAAAIIKRMASK